MKDHATEIAILQARVDDYDNELREEVFEHAKTRKQLKMMEARLANAHATITTLRQRIQVLEHSLRVTTL